MKLNNILYEKKLNNRDNQANLSEENVYDETRKMIL